MSIGAVGRHFRSNVIGYIALFCFVISGTAQALPGIGSVDSGDIKDRQVRSRDLAVDSVGSANVIDHSLTAADLSSGALAGATGPAGPKGDPGPTGPQGPSGVATLGAGTVTATELAAGAVTSTKLADGSITNTKLQSNAVDGGKVANNSLTGADLEGADLTGAVGFAAGSVANGRCEQVELAIGGAHAGEAVIISTKGALQDGVLLIGKRVPSDGHVTADLCNFSGTTMTAVDNLPIHVITLD